MKNLINKIFLILFILLITSCVTRAVFEIKSFEKSEGDDDFHVITVDSDRVKQECVFLNAEAENKWRHQYMMYVLNSKNEVIPIIYSLHQEKSVCLAHLKKVEKILKKNVQVEVCARDKFQIDVTSEERAQDFGRLGKHHVHYDYLTFDSICSSKECYRVNEASTKTCPGFKKL